MTRSKISTRLCALAASLMVALAGGVASAAASSPRVVEYQQANGGTLLIQLADGTNYVAFRNALNSCGATSIDTIKSWLALGQSALLSGKKLLIYSSVCNAGTSTTSPNNMNQITTIDLGQ